MSGWNSSHTLSVLRHLVYGLAGVLAHLALPYLTGIDSAALGPWLVALAVGWCKAVEHWSEINSRPPTPPAGPGPTLWDPEAA